jgi:hypothetical protein
MWQASASVYTLALSGTFSRRGPPTRWQIRHTSPAEQGWLDDALSARIFVPAELRDPLCHWHFPVLDPLLMLLLVRAVPPSASSLAPSKAPSPHAPHAPFLHIVVEFRSNHRCASQHFGPCLPLCDEILPSLGVAAEEEVEEKVINEQYKTWRVNSR